MKNAIKIIGEGRIKRYVVVRVGWCYNIGHPDVPGCFRTLEAAQAAADAAGVHIDVVGDSYAIMD